MIRSGLIFLFAVAAGIAFAAESPRERISINDGWRFTKGDPANVQSEDLLYDVRPVAKGDDQKERLAKATEDGAKVSAATHPVLKPWTLPGIRAQSR